MIQSPDITKIASEPRRVFFLFNRRRLVEEWLGVHARRQKAKPPVAPPPDGLRPTEAARKLGCSIKTLLGHVASGALKYVALGHGKKRQRKMFTDADINDFIANRTRKASPCPCIAGRARPTGTSISGAEVIDFRLPRKPPTSGKRKK
jgi:hypothetical protein